MKKEYGKNIVDCNMYIWPKLVADILINHSISNLQMNGQNKSSSTSISFIVWFGNERV